MPTSERPVGKSRLRGYTTLVSGLSIDWREERRNDLEPRRRSQRNLKQALKFFDHSPSMEFYSERLWYRLSRLAKHHWC